MHVECEIVWKPARAGRFYELLLIVDDAEWKAVARFDGIPQVESLEQRQKAPGKETIRCVPRIRPGGLGTEDGVIHVEVQHLIGMRLRARIRSHQHVPFLRSEDRRVGKECRCGWSPYNK